MPDILPGAPSQVAQAPQNKTGADAFQRDSRYVPAVSSAAPVKGLASGLAALGDGLEDLAVPFAKRQAAADVAADPLAGGGSASKAVTLDASGMPQVFTPGTSFILGRAGAEYQHAVETGTEAAATAAITEKIAEFRVANETKPQEFRATASAYAESLRAANPGEVGNALAARAHNLAAQNYSNLIEVKAQRDTAASLQSITTGIDDTNNQLRALARQGAIYTPQYDQLQDQLQDAYDNLGVNPKFGYSQDKIDSEKAHAFDMLNGEYVVGRIDETFNRKGKAAALEVIKEKIENNPDLKISDAERGQLRNYAISRLSYLSTEAESNLAALKPTIELQVKALQRGNSGPDRVSEHELDQTVDQLKSLGAFKEVEQLQAARIVSNRTSAFRNLSPDQKSIALLGAAGAGVGGPVASGVNSEQGVVQFFVSKGWSQTQASGIAGNLLHESGGRLNPAAINHGDGADGSDSIGIGQWNGSRAVDLKAFAAAQGKPWQDLGVQLAFVQHELEGKEGNAAKMLRGAKDARSAAAAFALGYERPQGFQTGVPEKVLGWQNRLDQTTRLAGGGAAATALPGSDATQTGVAALGQPFTDAEARNNPWLRTAYRQQIQIDDATQVRFAKAQFEALETSIKLSGSPSPDMVGSAATALQIADRFPEQLGEQATKLRGALAGHPAGFDAAGLPDQGSDLLSKTEELARHGDPFGNAVYSNIKAGIDQGRKLLEDDQFEYARQAHWIGAKPMPLNPADPAQLQQGIIQRAVSTAKIAAKQGLEGASIFSKQGDLPVVKDIMTHGTVDQRVGLLTAISTAHLTEPVLKETLRQIAKPAAPGQDNNMMALAVAGSVARFNPDAARAIVAGQSAMQEEPKYAPKEDLQAEFAKAISYNDLPSPDTREAMSGAVRAYYAKLSAEEGDITGVVNDARLRASIEAVSGGVRSYRGSSFIAPWYGASQSDTDAAVRSLSDADFAGARTTNGDSFPAAALKPSFLGSLTWNNWRLQSLGEGTYRVFAGSDDRRQYLGDGKGGYFVLNLGTKRRQVEQAAAGPLLMQSNRGNLYNSALMGGGN